MPPHDPKRYSSEAAIAVDSSLPISHNNSAITSKKITYPFVDLVRFVSTIGIVFMHAGMPMAGRDFYTVLHGVNHVEYYFFIKQFFKFSTICYFLIAGFLLADKSISTEPFIYFKRRLNMIARPYVLAIILFIIILSIKDALLIHHFGLYDLYETAKYTVLYTPFWYIPNYFVCLLVIVCCSKFLDSLYFGGVLFLITLGYTYFNVYSHSYTSSHTTALFGFVFYMWLGVFIKRKNLIGRIQKANLAAITAVLVLVFLLCNAESYYLFHYTLTHDSLNTLRFSNQLYSLMVFIFLIRCCTRAPRFGIFNPRKETYGIYLYHTFFVITIIPLLETWIGNYYGISFFSYDVFHIIGVSVLNFVICYMLTTLLVKVLLRYKMAYLPDM